jgi:hypothetical protein
MRPSSSRSAAAAVLLRQQDQQQQDRGDATVQGPSFQMTHRPRERTKARGRDRGQGAAAWSIARISHRSRLRWLRSPLRSAPCRMDTSRAVDVCRCSMRPRFALRARFQGYAYRRQHLRRLTALTQATSLTRTLLTRKYTYRRQQFQPIDRAHLRCAPATRTC